MSVFVDLDAALADTALRLESARVAVSMLGDLVDELGVRGFEVDVIQSELDGAVLHVALRITAPADPITTGPAVEGARIEVDELVEESAAIVTASTVPEFSSARLPEVVPVAPTPDVAAGVLPAPEVKKYDPWTEEEDALFMQMKGDGVAYSAIAAALGRSKDACSFRWSKHLNARAQRVALSKPAPKVAPAPVRPPEPAPPARVPLPPFDVATKDDLGPVFVAPSVNVPRPLWPDLAPDSITSADMRGHLLSLYGPTPDPDIVAADLDLVEMLVRGDGAQAVATAFDWSKAEVLQRWSLLRGGVPVSVKFQQAVLNALRALAGPAA